MANLDGTVQVAPPTRSAFAPQPTQPAPPPQMPGPGAAGPAGQQGIAGAIQAMIAALAHALAPRSIVDRSRAIQGGVEEGSGGPPGSDLGSQF